MSTLSIVIITLLSAAVVTAIYIGVAKLVKKARFNRKMKEVKAMVNEMISGELYIVHFGKNITVEMEDLSIVNVGIGANDYPSLAEALVYETVGAYRRHQLFELQEDLEKAYKLWHVQAEVTQEIRQEEQVFKQATRKEKFFTVIDTGDMDGKVYIYKPTQFVLGTHLKAEIVEDRFGYLSIDTVWYAPEGNVTSPKAIYKFDIRTQSGSKSYAHYVENSGKFDNEAVKMLDIIERLDKYNQLVEEGRITEENGTYHIQAPAIKEAKQEINEQFDEPAVVSVEELV